MSNVNRHTTLIKKKKNIVILDLKICGLKDRLEYKKFESKKKENDMLLED